MILMEFTSRSPRATILFVKYLTLEYILGSIASQREIDKKDNELLTDTTDSRDTDRPTRRFCSLPPDLVKSCYSIFLTMYRLSCLVLAFGLVSGLSTLQKRDWSTHGIFDNVELQCSHGSLAVAHVGILLTDYSQQSCLEYISDPQHITDELRRYCDIHGTKARCTFKLADILGHEPDPACLDNYDVISICQTF
ncbi:uncharacterized protein LOC119718835 isoform X1 [Patiria miniata]|uniref:Uncharacterized protein n=1 Tax=Patiria miniata TaxID=46514 RepID=A0A913YXT8_PATMI|nr:uncharacterized protein LOC119718835 isoform X1 [Patiria miniata]